MKSKKYILIVSVILVILVIFYFVFAYLVNPPVSVTMSPETTLAQTTNAQTPVTLSFTLTPKVSMIITSAYLQTVGTTTIPSERVQLSKNTDGAFVGTLVAPSEWLAKPQTVSFVLYLNSVKTAKIIRFASTDVSVTLPPDPGEAGKATLSGIDSDNDGVRDDLEREIVFMYPGNDTVRRVLRAMVKKEQDVITTNGDYNYFKDLILSYFAFENCYNYLEFGLGFKNGYTNEYTQILNTMLLNTPDRLSKDRSNSNKATPYITTTNFDSEACTQPLVKGQY